MLHCDNAPVHPREGVQESWANFGFIRMEHPLYDLYFAPCDFFFAVQ
jgi:hypothetical protein